MAPLKIEKGADGNVVISLDHKDNAVASRLAMEGFGSGSCYFLSGIFDSLVDATDATESNSVEQMNFVMSVVQGIEPKDEIEAMLTAQIAITHRLMMRQAGRLARTSLLYNTEIAGRLYNQLARTLTAQVDALKRYRTGGEQNVRVEHVTINEGGQAIVGNVETGGRGVMEKSDANRARSAQVHGHVKAFAPPLSGARSSRLDRLSNARRARWWEEGRTKRRLRPWRENAERRCPRRCGASDDQVRSMRPAWSVNASLGLDVFLRRQPAAKPDVQTRPSAIRRIASLQTH
jgi:hypothetical protein